MKHLRPMHTPHTELFLGWPIDRRLSFIILTCLSALQLALTWRAWREGIVADNDFVGHLALLHEWTEQAEKFGIGFHWTQKFNFGQPLLMFNLPPLSTVSAWLLTCAGFSPVTALKLLLTASLISTPWLMYWWHRKLMPKTRILALVAAALSVFLANELWGLGFHFLNGMINAAISLPMAILFFGCAEKLFSAGGNKRLKFAGFSLSFAIICLTHLHTAYLSLIFWFVFLGGKAFNHRDLRLFLEQTLVTGCGLILGGGLAMFWFLPSLPHMVDHSWLHIWSPPAAQTLSELLDGKLLAGVRGSGLNAFSADARVSAWVLLAFAVTGTVAKLRRKRDYGLIAAAALSLWIMLSPAIAGPLIWIPLFDRILHFRVLSFFSIFIISLAARGVYSLRKMRFGRYMFVIAMLAIFFSSIKISNTIKTEANFQSNRDNLLVIANWLKAYARDERIYAEFSGHSPGEISANYLRHMLPVLSGVNDGASFIYENSFTSEDLQRRGIYWGSVIPLIDLAPSYGINFLAIWTESAFRAFSQDSRWKLQVTAGKYRVFERVRKIGENDHNRTAAQLFGIGENKFKVIFDRVLTGLQNEIHSTIPYSPGWELAERPDITLSKDESGFLSFTSSNGIDVQEPLKINWRADSQLTSLGVWVSVASLCVLLLIVSISWNLLLSWNSRLVFVTITLLICSVGASVIWQGYRMQNRQISSPFEGFGKEIPVHYLNKVGTYRDFEMGYLFRLSGSRWQGVDSNDAEGGRILSGRKSGPLGADDVVLSVGKGVDLEIIFEFSMTGPTDPPLIAIGKNQERRVFAIESGTKVIIPADAVEPLLVENAALPGYQLGIAILNRGDFRLKSIQIANGVQLKQIEHFAQVDGDLGNAGVIGQRFLLKLQGGLAMISKFPWPSRAHRLLVSDSNRRYEGCHSVWYAGLPAHGGQTNRLYVNGQHALSKSISSRRYSWFNLGRVADFEERSLLLELVSERSLNALFETPVAVSDALAFVKEGATSKCTN